MKQKVLIAGIDYFIDCPDDLDAVIKTSDGKYTMPENFPWLNDSFVLTNWGTLTSLTEEDVNSMKKDYRRVLLIPQEFYME